MLANPCRHLSSLLHADGIGIDRASTRFDLNYGYYLIIKTMAKKPIYSRLVDLVRVAILYRKGAAFRGPAYLEIWEMNQKCVEVSQQRYVYHLFITYVLEATSHVHGQRGLGRDMKIRSRTLGDENLRQLRG